MRKLLSRTTIRPPRHPLRRFVAASPRGSFGAFTLVEVVIALTLGVTLLVAVQGLIVGAYRTSDEVERRAADNAAHALPFELLRLDLENRPAGGGLMLADNALRLTTLNTLQSSRLAARHAVKVQYTVEPSNDGLHRLTRREGQLGQRGQRHPGVILADGISEVTLAVFDGREWRDRWPPQITRTAYAVRFEVTWPDGEQEQLIIPLAPLAWSRHDG